MAVESSIDPHYIRNCTGIMAISELEIFNIFPLHSPSPFTFILSFFPIDMQSLARTIDIQPNWIKSNHKIDFDDVAHLPNWLKKRNRAFNSFLAFGRSNQLEPQIDSVFSDGPFSNRKKHSTLHESGCGANIRICYSWAPKNNFIIEVFRKQTKWQQKCQWSFSSTTFNVDKSHSFFTYCFLQSKWVWCPLLLFLFCFLFCAVSSHMYTAPTDFQFFLFV